MKRSVVRGRRVPAVVLAALLSGCMAMGPGGGPGGPSGPPGGGRANGVDRAMGRDPWLAWAQLLRAEAAQLAAEPPSRVALDEFVQDLELAARVRAARVERALRGQRISVSAHGDVGHELRREADEAEDWRATVKDLRDRWERLRGALPAPQLARVEALYLDATRSAMQGAADDATAGSRTGGPPGGPGGRR